MLVYMEIFVGNLKANAERNSSHICAGMRQIISECCASS